MSRSRFDAVAQQYDAGRPGYPDELYDAIEELSGSFINGSMVADIGAGTGISTRGLVDRGAHVVAVDHGGKMLATLRGRTPQVPAVLADANLLPFADGSFDLVTFAQSWHWVDPERAPREVVRVVRGGGAVAIWWNTADESAVGWLDAHRDRLVGIGQRSVGARFEAAWASIPDAFPGQEIATARVKWERTVPKEVILDEVRSKSYVEELGPEAAAAVVERERELLPDGPLRQPFVTALAVIRKTD